MAKVFISYDRDDSDFAELVQGRLEKAGHDTLLDIEILNAGDDWRDELDQAIRDSHALVVIMTPEARASAYVAYEWAFALGANINIIPLELKASAFHPRLDVLQRLDFTNKARPWPALLSEVEKAAEAKPSTTIYISPSAPPVIQQAVKSLDCLDEDEQLAGVKSLAQTDHPAAREVLVKALQHPVKSVRIAAALEFPNKEDPRRLPGLIAHIRDDYWTKFTSGDRLYDAWYGPLSKMGLSAVPYLLEALVDEEYSYMRHIFVKTLGNIGDVSTVPGLIDVLKDQDEYVRSLVAKALGKIGDKMAIPMLHEVLEDPIANVRAAAIMALGELKDESAADKILHALLDDTEAYQVHAASAFSVGQLGVTKAIPKLQQLLQDGRSPPSGARSWDIHASAAEALGLLGDKSIVDQFREIFSTGHQKPGFTAFHNALGVALIRLEGAGAFSMIIEALKANWNGLDSSLIEAMGAVGESAIPTLCEVLSFVDHQYWQDAVIQALKTIGTSEALTAVRQWERQNI